MLREVGKRDEELLVGFLQQHAGDMPRTMLRYAAERLDAPLRAKLMAAVRRRTVSVGAYGQGANSWATSSSKVFTQRGFHTQVLESWVNSQAGRRRCIASPSGKDQGT